MASSATVSSHPTVNPLGCALQTHSAWTLLSTSAATGVQPTLLPWQDHYENLQHSSQGPLLLLYLPPALPPFSLFCTLQRVFLLEPSQTRPGLSPNLSNLAQKENQSACRVLHGLCGLSSHHILFPILCLPLDTWSLGGPPPYPVIPTPGPWQTLPLLEMLGAQPLSSAGSWITVTFSCHLVAIALPHQNTPYDPSLLYLSVSSLF